MPDPILDELIEKARNYKPTPAEQRAYKISFVYGNVSLRADVERVLDEMEREKPNGQQ